LESRKRSFSFTDVSGIVMVIRPASSRGFQSPGSISGFQSWKRTGNATKKSGAARGDRLEVFDYLGCQLGDRALLTERIRSFLGP
jgi:hypothetical protein